MIEGLNRALALVERQLTTEIDVDELARTALTSSYHFRRMFSSLAGMPLSAYVRRRRMTLAAAEVVAGHGSLLETALRYGYGSTEAFGRAFRDVHGLSPSEAGTGHAELTTQPRLRFRLTVEGDTPVHHRMVDKDAFAVAGRHVRVPLQFEGVKPHIGAFIAALPDDVHARIKALSDQEPAGILAVTHDPRHAPIAEEGSDIDYHHATITSGPVPDDLDVLEVPALTWAVFEVSGPFPETLQRACADTAAVWFPSNPYRSVPGPSLLRMELADDQATATCELWIPVEPEPASDGAVRSGARP